MLLATSRVDLVSVMAEDPVTVTAPVNASGGVGTFHFEISPALPPGLAMNASDGSISGSAVGESAETVYTVTISDSIAQRASATFSLRVFPTLKTFVFNASETHRVNDTVSYTPATTSGGLRPYHYTVTPALPAGLVMNEGTGAVTGIATAASAFTTYTYTVMDGLGHFVTGKFSLLIEPELSAITVTPTISVVADANVMEIPIKAEGGLGLHHFSVQPALPAGLTMDELSGAIKNIPGTRIELSPETVYSVTVTDSANPRQSASATFKLGVSPNPGIAITLNAPAKPQRVNQAFPPYAPVTASSGVGSALTYKVAPALPAGLSMDSATGIISGMPTVEQIDDDAARYTVTVTDSASPAHEAEARFGLVTYQLPTATVLESSKTYQVGEAVNYQPASGVSAAGRPVTYRVAGGGLPPGLKMDPNTGVITGMAREKMKNEFFVYISDLAVPGVVSASAFFSLEIVQPAVP